MTKPDEICVVTVGGSNYKWWKEVEVNRDYSQYTSEARLVVAEIGDLNKGWKSLRLKPGDPAEVTLAGQLAATGAVSVRQVVYDAQNHAVRIIVQSKTADLNKTSLDLPPGQFKNQKLKQLVNAATKPFGVNFSIRGSPAGVDLPFERVSIHIGESPFQFILRLCQMRNIHFVDDAQGNIVGQRGDGKVIAELQEGRNILSAEMIWSENVAVSKTQTVIEQHGNNKHWGDETRKHAAEGKNQYYKRYGPLVVIAPQPGNAQDAQMFANHSADLNAATMFIANVTVRGWLRDNGSLWLNDVGQQVELYSPMLLPMDKATLAIQAATCRQNDQTGTTTTLTLVLPQRLGTPNATQMNPDGPTTPEPAQPKDDPV